ncbi:hypothetical protein J9332_16020 [Aquimarina celericrescens]|nr:hypothetical protein [Aquimarina celericrescens]
MLLLLFVIVACNSDDDVTTACDQFIIVSDTQFENAPKDPVTINSAIINDDCITINFSAGGCDGDSWEVKLIDSGGVSFSLPPQRNLRLSLKNEELCEAFITRELTFDIGALQVSGNQVLLNIQNFDQQILYEY